MAEAKKTTKTAKKSQIEATPKIKISDDVDDEGPKTAAKAGKRSTKAIKATEERIAKEERKQKTSEKPKIAKKATAQIKPPRSKAERTGKKYREAIKQIDASKTYNLAEAVDLAIKTSTTKFDATVEVHINLLVDPKQADQNVRDSVVMPHGSGKSARIAAFVEGEDVAKAKKAGADISGVEDILAALEKDQIEFDVMVSTPSLMWRLGKYARLLGPRGLMPNPKSGTVTTDLVKAIQEAKAGRVEFRVDPSGIIHLGIGKASFGPQKLLENAQTIISSVRSAKPASVKGVYIKSAYVTSTMGPSIKTEL